MGRYQCSMAQHVWQQHYILVCQCTSGPWPTPRSHCFTKVTGTLLPSGWNLWITEHELWNYIALNVTLFVVRFYFWLIFWKFWPLRGQVCACKTTACLLGSLTLYIVGALPTFPQTLSASELHVLPAAPCWLPSWNGLMWKIRGIAVWVVKPRGTFASDAHY